MAMKKYHMRRADKEIRNKRELLRLVSRRPFVTIAMCAKDDPYLVTVNHVYDARSNCLYFHSANRGKKSDYLEANPRVYAQVVEDRGYVKGQCSYDYYTVNMTGKASRVDSVAEKRRALTLLMKKLEPGLSADDARKKFIDESSFREVSIYRIDITSMTGKARVPE